MGVACPYRMVQTARNAAKTRFVAWHCGLEADHDGWHFPKEERRQIVTNYFLMPPDEEGPELTPAEVLDREWLDVDDLLPTLKSGAKGKPTTDLAKLAVRLEATGWEVHVGRATHFTGDTYVKSTGAVKPGKTEQWTWLDAVQYSSHRHLTANKDRIMLNGIEVELSDLALVEEE